MIFRKTGHPQNSRGGQGWKQASVVDTLNVFDNSEMRTPTLITYTKKGGNMDDYIVRRLTPTECARLQGFPDWWCEGVPHTDSAEYKMWGNGMALPCALYVMEGIADALDEEAD